MKKTVLTIAAAALFATGFTAGGIATAAAQTVEGPKVNWRFSSWGQRRAITEGLEHIVAEAARRTNGNFQIKIFYGEALSQAKENLDGISVGAFEAAYFCGSYHPAKHKPLNVLDLPFAAGTFDDPSWIRSDKHVIRYLYMRSARSWSQVPPGAERYEKHFRR